MEIENKQIRYSYSLAGFVVLIAGVAPQLFTGAIRSSLLQNVDNLFLAFLLPLVVGYAILIPVAWLIVRKVARPAQMPEKHKLSFGKMFAWFLAFVALSRLVLVATNLIQTAITGEYVEDPVTSLQLDSPGMMFVLSVCVAPVAEELIFRGLLYRALAPYGGKAFVLISALLFALVHMNPPQIPFAFVIGLFFAYVMYRTGNVLFPILFHFITNLISGISVFFLGTDAGLQITGLIAIGIIIVGVVCGIVLLAKRRVKQDIVFEPATVAPAKAAQVFANPGIILAILGMIVFTIVNAIVWSAIQP